MTTQQSIPPSDNLPLADDRPAAPPRDWMRDTYDEQSPLGPLRPIARRWPLVLVITLLCGAAGAVVGLKRSPNYTASSSINVGRVDVRVQALPGYVAGAETLAGAYSRIVDSQVILQPVARRLGMSPLQLANHVAATPVPSSPIFRIIATGGSQARAIQITNAVTNEMKRYVTASNAAQNGVDSLLRQYQRQVAAADRLHRTMTQLQAKRTAALGTAATAGTTTTTTPTTTTGGAAPSLNQIRRAKVQYATAQLRAQSLAAQYESRADEVASTAGVQVLSTPLAATSDRNSKMQRLVAVGLVGGLVAGSLLALLLDAARRRRSA
jgi:capsular polysaccharide biosynthesis protein